MQRNRPAAVSPTSEAAAPFDAASAEISLVSVAAVDDALRAAWRALAMEAAAPNPYFEPWFLEPALRLLDPEGRARICIVKGADGALAALAPMTIEPTYAKIPLRHLAVWRCLHIFNGAPLLRRGWEAGAFIALFRWLDRRPEGARFLRFPQLLFEGPLRAALEAACEADERSWRRPHLHGRAALDGDADFEAVMRAAMSGKKRKELRRLERRFADLGDARFQEIPVAEAIAPFIALEAAGWKGEDPDGFPLNRSAEERRFFQEAMTEGARRGAVSCLALTLDGEPAAMLFLLRAGGVWSAFKTAYDESLNPYSPGVQLLIETTRRTLVDPEIHRLDSCARAGHPVADKLWPARLPVAQIDVPSRHAYDRRMLGLAAGLERLHAAARRKQG